MRKQTDPQYAECKNAPIHIGSPWWVYLLQKKAKRIKVERPSLTSHTLIARCCMCVLVAVAFLLNC